LRSIQKKNFPTIKKIFPYLSNNNNEPEEGIQNTVEEQDQNKKEISVGEDEESIWLNTESIWKDKPKSLNVTRSKYDDSFPSLSSEEPKLNYNNSPTKTNESINLWSTIVQTPKTETKIEKPPPQIKNFKKKNKKKKVLYSW